MCSGFLPRIGGSCFATRCSRICSRAGGGRPSVPADVMAAVITVPRVARPVRQRNRGCGHLRPKVAVDGWSWRVHHAFHGRDQRADTGCRGCAAADQQAAPTGSSVHGDQQLTLTRSFQTMPDTGFRAVVGRAPSPRRSGQSQGTRSRSVAASGQPGSGQNRMESNLALRQSLFGATYFTHICRVGAR